ncbi:MAG: hypothetical protein GY737_00365 [Desulfobacteraceae bacterium]|nr:hypothetical protein [Desulfobacteraceae bacterium]
MSKSRALRDFLTSAGVDPTGSRSFDALDRVEGSIPTATTPATSSTVPTQLSRQGLLDASLEIFPSGFREDLFRGGIVKRRNNVIKSFNMSNGNRPTAPGSLKEFDDRRVSRVQGLADLITGVTGGGGRFAGGSSSSTQADFSASKAPASKRAKSAPDSSAIQDFKKKVL